MRTRTTAAITLSATVVGGLVALVATRTMAAGIPATGLTYAAFLEDEAGAPVDGARQISVGLWDAATEGARVCDRPSAATTVTRGRFSVLLPDACTTAVKANKDLWVEVQVGGASLGRTKLGAVPYAIEADRAQTAANATTAATANAAGGALKTQLDALTSCPDPDIVAAVGFCIWEDDTLNEKAAYTMTYKQAAAKCESQGARLCSLAEVAAAQAAGASWCHHAWTSDRSGTQAYRALPMQTTTANCGDEGINAQEQPLDNLNGATCCKY
jgi:hypothetical protein